MTTSIDIRPGTRAIGYAAGFATLWAVLAWLNPTTTYHLAPLIVPLVPAGVHLSEGVSRNRAVRLSVLAGGISFAVIAVLSTTSRLTGPSLLPTGGAVLEAIAFTVIATLAGVILGSLPKRATV